MLFVFLTCFSLSALVLSPLPFAHFRSAAFCRSPSPSSPHPHPDEFHLTILPANRTRVSRSRSRSHTLVSSMSSLAFQRSRSEHEQRQWNTNGDRRRAAQRTAHRNDMPCSLSTTKHNQNIIGRQPDAAASMYLTRLLCCLSFALCVL